MTDNHDAEQGDSVRNIISNQWDVIKRFDNYINSTNTKAALLLAFCAAISTIVAYNSRFIIHINESVIYRVIVTVIIGAILIFVAIGATYALRSIFPDISNGDKPSLISFVDVSKYVENPREYYHQIVSCNDDNFLFDLCNQSAVLANIAKVKYESLAHSAGLIRNTVYLVIVLIFIIFVVILLGS